MFTQLFYDTAYCHNNIVENEINILYLADDNESFEKKCKYNWLKQ